MPLFLLLLALCSPALAARLQLQVADDTLTVGQVVALELQVVDGRASGVPDVQASDGLSVRFRGQSQSMSIVGMQTTRVVRYSYSLQALTQGTHAVGPVTVEVGGQLLKHPALTIEVSDVSAAEQERASLTATLSDDAPYEGEVVVYALTFRRRDETRNIRWTPPEAPGFVAEPSAERVERDESKLNNGVEEAVLTILEPYRATAAGSHTVSPAVVAADMAAPPDPRTGRRRVDVFGRARTTTRNFSSGPLNVEVRPLPAEGRPADFAGLVGTFTVRAATDNRTVALGESLTVTITVEGKGALAGLSLPAPDDQTGLRVYDDAPELSTKVTADGLVSRAVFRRAVVPDKEGALTIPPISLSAFDPEAGAYTTLSTRPISLTVTAGDGGGELASFGGDDAKGPDVEALGDDILPAPGNAIISDRTVAAAWPLLAGLPALSFVFLAALGVRDWGATRSTDPWRDLKRRAATLPADPTAQLAALDALFREAASLRLGCPPGAIDRTRLASLGASAVELYGALESARYGGGASSGLADRVRAFVEQTGGAHP